MKFQIFSTSGERYNHPCIIWHAKGHGAAEITTIEQMMDVANLAGYDDIRRLIVAIDPGGVLPTLEIYDTYRE